MKDRARLTPSKILYVGLSLASLLLSLGHFGPLQGSFVSLLLTVGTQIYLFGYLAARAFGLLRESDTLILRLIWIVTCGLGINIVLGAGARLLLVPLNAYVIGLHLLMVLFSLAPAAAAPLVRMERQTLLFYLLLVMICVVFIVVGWERNRLWLDGYEDQSLPVSLADWWAHAPVPENLVSRQIAETNTLSYWSSDGLTYVFAAWVWTGGFSAVQLVWYALTPLFAWLVPLAHYALAYRLTKRADTAAWTAGMVLLLALTTINGSPLYGGAWMFGQEAAFQLDTLRTFSTALLMPLVLFVFFTGLRAPQLRYYLLTGILMLALALTHPRQLLALMSGLYAILALAWLMKPAKARLRPLIPLGFALLPALLVPLWQYTATLHSALQPSLLPVLASTLSNTESIIEPAALLFNPLIVLALVLSGVAVVRLRQSLSAQFIVATTLVMIVLSYIPPILNSILGILGSYFGLHFVLELFFIVPYGFILGIAVSFVHDALRQHLRFRPALGNGFIAAGFAVTALVLLIEPFPFAQSARAQIESANEAEAFRDIHPFDAALLNRLRALPVGNAKVVYLTSNRLASYVIESLPNAFITGGRPETNPAFAGSSRFFAASTAPWLDAEDIAFLQKYQVDYLVLSADNTRIPQLLLQPTRFEWVDTVAGYLIFHVGQLGTVTPVDQAFTQMNALYPADANPRWGGEGFHLKHHGDTGLWQPMSTAWNAQLAQDPANDSARYGLAFAQLLAGDDPTDLWTALSERHPEIFLLTNVQAQLLLDQGQAQRAEDLLVSKLDIAPASERILAARELLTDSFFHQLTPTQLDTILALEGSDASSWMQLLEWSNAVELKTDAAFLEANANLIRTRAALLMHGGRSEVAQRWLNQLPAVAIRGN